jgi:hypothetical protein
MIEFGVPPRRRLRRLWRLYTRVGLPAARLVDLWRRADIDGVWLRRMSHGAGVLMVGVRRR